MTIDAKDDFDAVPDSKPAPASEEDYRAWETGLMRGVSGGIKRTGGMETRRGQNNAWENVYTVIDKEFATPVQTATTPHAEGCRCLACQQTAFHYLTWHQTKHKSAKNPNCRICQAEVEFRKQHPEFVGRRVGMEEFDPPAGRVRPA